MLLFDGDCMYVYTITPYSMYFSGGAVTWQMTKFSWDCRKVKIATLQLCQPDVLEGHSLFGPNINWTCLLCLQYNHILDTPVTYPFLLARTLVHFFCPGVTISMVLMPDSSQVSWLPNISATEVQQLTLLSAHS